ncbi:hypothetical protein [Sorangium sp. So ce362]|uniref:hypothetical protein n=1 Tax=Sorangium sp. So ce362 TaxID=3133303 RepID=UPI003F62A7FF
MTTVSGILSIGGNSTFPHATTESKAPVLTIHHQLWTQVKTAENGSYVGSQLWVENTGNTLLTDISVTLTIQGGDGIWTAQFCDSSGNLLPQRYNTYPFPGTLQPRGISSKQTYWWKPSKPDVTQNGSDFTVSFTAIPQFTVHFQDNDQYFTDTCRVTIG